MERKRGAQLEKAVFTVLLRGAYNALRELPAYASGRKRSSDDVCDDKYAAPPAPNVALAH